MVQDLSAGEHGGTRTLLIVLASWGLAVAAVAWAGLFQAVYPPLIGVIIVLGVVIPAGLYAASERFGAYIRRVGLWPLTVFHVWRVPAALLFFWYGSRGLLPGPFAIAAGAGDLVAGLLAAVVAFQPEASRRFLAFHVFGFADLVVAVGIGMTFTVMKDPRMSAIQSLPMALIPLYGVGVSGASHLMAFDLLRRGLGVKRRPSSRPVEN